MYDLAVVLGEYELRVVCVDGVVFVCCVAGGVEAECGVCDPPEVCCVVVEEPAWVDGWADGDAGVDVPACGFWVFCYVCRERGRCGHIDACEFGVESRVFCDAGNGEVVGVRVLEVGEEEDVRLDGADDAGDFVPGFDGMDDLSVGQVEEDALDWPGVGVGVCRRSGVWVLWWL